MLFLFKFKKKKLHLSGHYIFSIKFETFLQTKIYPQMSTIQEFCAYIDDSLFLSITSLGFFFNLILYSIFDHLTFGGWGIFLFAKKSRI
jgi:hypothetical protein